MIRSFRKKNSDRASSYKFLQKCFDSPDEKLSDIVINLNESICELYPKIIKYIPNGNDDLLLLRDDFSKLFIGPENILSSPLIFFYFDKDKKIQKESIVDVNKLYIDEGFESADHNEPDHICVQLEFMNYLISKEVRLLKKIDTSKTFQYFYKQKKFLNSYLGRCVPEFSRAIIANAQTEFYKDIARLTISFIQEEIKYLESQKNIFNT